jgi:hypothetical protein
VHFAIERKPANEALMMFRAGTLLAGPYDPLVVALSVVIAVAASYAALDLAGRVTASNAEIAELQTRFASLTPRERQVLPWVVSGRAGIERRQHGEIQTKLPRVAEALG